MDRVQLEDYFRRYYSFIYRIAFVQLKSHSDAEDIAQEVFVRMIRYNPKFEDVQHEKAWIIKTCINLCKDLLKSKWHGVDIGFDNIEKKYFVLPNVEIDETLWLVMELDDKYKNVLYLFYYEDYSIKEIAKIMDIPENTVKTNLRRGREVLKQKILLYDRYVKRG